MTSAEARYLRARNACHAAWASSQPQYVIEGVLDEEPALPLPPCEAGSSSSAPAFTSGADPCHARVAAPALGQTEPEFVRANGATAGASAPSTTTTEGVAQVPSDIARATLQGGL